MTEHVKAIPEGYHTANISLVLRGAAKAIEFYKEAFGAEEICRMPGPGDKLMHAEIKIGDSMIMLSDEFPEYGASSPLTLGGSPVTISLYVENADAVFEKAVAAGATVQMPLGDQFWGDRYGKLVDPFGHVWGVATHIEDVSPEEMQRRAEAFTKSFAAGGAE